MQATQELTNNFHRPQKFKKSTYKIYRVGPKMKKEFKKNLRFLVKKFAPGEIAPGDLALRRVSTRRISSRQVRTLQRGPPLKLH